MTLGPRGTFSDEAAQRIVKNGISISYTKTFHETLFRVSEDVNRVSAHKIYLDNLWTGNIDAVEVVEFPKASRERLIKISKNSFD